MLAPPEGFVEKYWCHFWNPYHCTVWEKGPKWFKIHNYRTDWLIELNVSGYYLLPPRANFGKIWKKYFNIFGLIRPKNGIECLRKYPKTASNQLMPEHRSCSTIKKADFKKERNFFLRFWAHLVQKRYWSHKEVP